MSTAERSFYQILGVSSEATASEVRTAYLHLARALHPDHLASCSDAEKALADRRMREINSAYEVLNDPQARQSYDRTSPPLAPSAP